MATLSALLLVLALCCSYLCARHGIEALMGTMRARGMHRAPSGTGVLQGARDLLDGIPVLRAFLERREERKRMEEFERGMPEAVRLMCIAIESGSSVVMALRYAAENCKEPLAGELKRTVWDLEAGQGLDEALENLRERTHGSEFAYLTVAMEIQHRSGGSLSSILENVSSMLRQSAELEDELQTKTSQGRLSSRIVAIMPFALLGILALLSPGYISSFLGSPLGLFLFFLALLLELAGVLLVHRSLVIDFAVDLEEGV